MQLFKTFQILVEQMAAGHFGVCDAHINVSNLLQVPLLQCKLTGESLLATRETGFIAWRASWRFSCNKMSVSQFRVCILWRTRPLLSLKASPSESLLTWSAVVKWGGLAFGAFPGCVTRCFTHESDNLRHAMSPKQGEEGASGGAFRLGQSLHCVVMWLAFRCSSERCRRWTETQQLFLQWPRTDKLQRDFHVLTLVAVTVAAGTRCH